MNGADDHVRAELGAYLLGGLEPADRRIVEAHVAACSSCRDELTELSVLPSLLDRLSADEATTGYEDARGRLDRSRDGAVVEVVRHDRRRLAAWRAATAVSTAAAALLGFLTWAPWEEPPDRMDARIVAIVGTAEDVQGTIAAYAWEWGTTVEIRVEDLPPAPAYLVWTVSDDGRRQQAGTWGPTSERAALVRGATAIQRSDLARVEVTDPAGSPLFAATFRDGG